MSTINDGGPAFPSNRDMRHNPDWDYEPGMSLRDYAALKAMQGFCANQACQPTRQEHFDNMAEDAYRMADAMLKARKEGGAS